MNATTLALFVSLIAFAAFGLVLVAAILPMVAHVQSVLR